MTGVHPTRPARACDIDRHVVVRSPSRQGVPTVAIDSPRLTTQTAGWILVVVAVSAAVLGVAHPVDSANRRLAATSTLTTPDSVLREPMPREPQGRHAHGAGGDGRTDRMSDALRKKQRSAQRQDRNCWFAQEELMQTPPAARRTPTPRRSGFRGACR